MRDWLERNGWWLTLLLIVASSLTGFVQLHHSQVESCRGQNEIRREIVAFLDSTIDRSRTSLQATVHSPFANKAVKDAARKNLANLERITRDAHNNLATRSCA